MKKLLKDAYKSISINNMKMIKGGEGEGGGSNNQPNNPPIVCFCKGRCFTGVDCTKGWY